MKQSSLRRIAVVALVVSAFSAGLSVDHVARAARRGSGESYGPLDVFAEVLANIQNAYVEPVSAQDLVYGAIEGMVSRLDAHTQFMRPEVYRALKEETAGEFEGLGLELVVKAEGLVVVSPLADSPGERAGILPGDRVLEMDGAATRDMSLAEATRRMKGRAGTKVSLRIMRDGSPSPQTFTLVRDRVRMQSV